MFFGELRELTKEEKAAQDQFNARVRRDADARILARIERWLNPRMLPERALPQALRPQPTHFDNILSDWHAGYLAVRELEEIPHELRQDLTERAPQAILRDIYRPVRRDTFVERTMHEIEWDPAGRRALAEAKQGLVREPLPQLESSVVLMMAEQRRRRRVLSRPWLPYRPDDAPRFHTPQGLPFGLGWDDQDDAGSGDDGGADHTEVAARAAFHQKWQVEGSDAGESETDGTGDPGE